MKNKIAPKKKNEVEEKAVAKTTRKPAEPTIMSLAKDPNYPVEKLQMLIKMKNDEEDRQARIKFEEDFSELQKKFAPVKRTKKNNYTGSKYAPVDEMQRQYGQLITEAGFSYYWEDDYLENGSLKSTFCISKHGHTKRNSVLLPAYEPDKGRESGKSIMNPMQAEGTRLTYAHRYTMKAGLGVTEEDEDQDGNYTLEDGLTYAEEIMIIRGSKNLDELKANYRNMYQRVNGRKDKWGVEIIVREYEKKKRFFLGEMK